MKGEKIKEILRIKGISQNQIARAIGESSQNLSAALAKDDVRTGLVESIAVATGLSLAEFYGEDYGITPVAKTASSTPGSENPMNNFATELLKEIAAQRQMTDKVLDQNSALLRIIEKQTR